MIDLIKVAEKTIGSLKRNNMQGHHVKDNAELLSLLSELIPNNATVGCGDSVTLEQTGVFDLLRSGAYVFLDKHAKGLSSADKREIYLKNFTADVFVTGTNAVTLNGELFNIDGNGSRVAPMIYGPELVIVVVGINKLVEDVKEAIKRTKQVAAPLDAKRLGKDTPCAKTGVCVDCKHAQRICNDFVLITGQFMRERIHVIIVDEALGY